MYRQSLKSGVGAVKDTRHSKGLSEGVEGGAPCDLPRSDVGVDEVQFVEQLPQLNENDRRTEND